MANTISRLFGPSPFKALKLHMHICLETAQQVPGLFEALNAGDQAGVKASKEKIFELEGQADRIKNELRAHLPKSLFLPVDRRDLLEVLRMQDSIADTAQDIAGLLVERPMSVPDHMKEPLMTLARRCVDVVEKSTAVVDKLDALVETGFRGREAERVAEMVQELNRTETESDELELQLTRLLFEHEDEMKPVSVMLWYRMIEWIGDLADYAEKVGDRLRLLIAR